MGELIERIEALDRDIKNVDYVSPEVGLSLIAVIKRAVEVRDDYIKRYKLLKGFDPKGAQTFINGHDAELLKLLEGE